MSDESTPTGCRVMCHCRPIIQRAHNLRDPSVVRAEKHIDPSRPHETILDTGTLEESFSLIFGEAVEAFNAKQKRKDRKIKCYLTKVIEDNRQGKHKNHGANGRRKPAYEMIIQIGNRDNHPDDMKTAEILREFCDFIRAKYPNIFPIGIYLHMDEFSIEEETGERVYSPAHIHFDFVFVAHLGQSLKTGMELQCSMSGALAEMGFVTSKGKGTAQTQFEEAVRHDLQDFAEQRGLLIDRTLGKKHKHQDKDIYQLRCDTEKRATRVQAAEAAIIEQKQQIDASVALLEQRKAEYDRYTEVSKEVTRANMTIDTEVDRLESDHTVPFSSRLSRFVGNVKKIGTKIITELYRYKSAFKRFWSFGSKEFRALADLMDRNKCLTYTDFHERYSEGKLDFQQKKHKPIIPTHKQHCDADNHSMSR